MSGPSPRWCCVTCDTCGIESPSAIGWKAARAVAKAEGWSRISGDFRCPNCRVDRRNGRGPAHHQVKVASLPKATYAALLVRSQNNGRTMAAEVREILAEALS